MHTFGLTSSSEEVRVDVRMHVHVEGLRVLTTNKLWKVEVLPIKAEQVVDLLLVPAEEGKVANVLKLKVHETMAHDRAIRFELCGFEGDQEEIQGKPSAILTRRQVRAEIEASLRRA